MSNKTWAAAHERGSSVGIKILLFVLRTFGYAVANLLLVPIVFYFYVSGRASREASLRYLDKVHAFGGISQRLGFWGGFAHFRNFANSAMDRVWFWQAKRDRFTFNMDALEPVAEYLNDGKGCLLLGAHMGSFDSLRVLCKDREVKVNAVMYLENAQRFTNMLKSINPDSQLNIINLKERSIDGVLEMKSCIDNGEIVAMLADRFHPTTKSRVVSCSFLGQEAPFPVNPWVVAGVLECPTFLVAGVQSRPRHYESVVQFVADKVSIQRSQREADLRKYISEYAVFLERLCCKYPYQWYNFFDFWRFDEQQEVSEN